jgi:hypothetical protein
VEAIVFMTIREYFFLFIKAVPTSRVKGVLGIPRVLFRQPRELNERLLGHIERDNIRNTG